MQIGDVEVQIETVREPGSEPTGVLADASERVRTAFDSAQDVILGMAARTVDVIGRLSSAAVCPAKLEIEFGLGFSAKGNVIVASGEANATLKVKLTYDANPE